MRVTRVPYPDELSQRFVAAARAAGVSASEDVSGPELDGAAISPVTIHKGQRWSTARGYSDRRHQGRGLPGDLPQIPRADTDAPSIMIGERRADFLLAQSATGRSAVAHN